MTSPVRGRIVAWAISEGIDPSELGLDYPLLRRAAALLAGRHPDAESLVVFFTAAAIGWSAFESLFADAIPHDDTPAHQARDAFLAYAHDLLRRELDSDTIKASDPSGDAHQPCGSAPTPQADGAR